MRAYLSLGSNLGDRAANLQEAIQRLGREGLHAGAVSPVYETEPQGRREQGWFLNCVVGVDTDLAPQGVLQRALGVEQAMGRERLLRWGPRVIDIDLLLYGDCVVNEPNLTIPHPRLHERAFALVPLADVSPETVIPGHGSALALGARCAAEPGQSMLRRGELANMVVPHVESETVAPGYGPATATAPAARVLPGAGGTRARVLARLIAAVGESVSGERLSAELGVSRAAIWKQVHALRAQGYPVRSHPGAGYSLAPDAAEGLEPLRLEVLRTSGMQRQVVGTVLRLLRQVDSTNAFATRLGMGGSPEGTVVVAEEQTAGRGRNGRSFLSPPGGVYLSAILRPRVPPTEAVRLTLLAALALSEAIETVSGLRPTIKWPNDVLIEDRKVCGILLEMVAAEDCVDFVVLGCGVNVVVAPPVPGACSLWSVGAHVSREPVAGALLDRLDACYRGFVAGRWDELLDAWRLRCATLGQDVSIRALDGGTVCGRAVDVTTDGALRVQARDGMHTLFAGDVLHLRRGGYGRE